jgi:type I restriction enzyme R subunit
MLSTSFWGADGKPKSAVEFLEELFGVLPAFFSSEEELRRLWGDPLTRKALLDRLSAAGYTREVLSTLQKLIDAEKSDLFDVLEYVSFAVVPITRELRVARAQSEIFARLDARQKEFLEFVLLQYIQSGVDELAEDRLARLLTLKYLALPDALKTLGSVEKIREMFLGFQKHLYTPLAV